MSLHVVSLILSVLAGASFLLAVFHVAAGVDLIPLGLLFFVAAYTCCHHHV